MAENDFQRGSLYTQDDEITARLTSQYLVREENPHCLSRIHHFLQSKGCQLPVSAVHSILQKYPKNFEIYQDCILYVKLITKVNLCETHCKKNETCFGDIPVCSGLHICKFFILSGNCSFGNQCKFGHDLTTSHNMKVLKEHFLDGASVKDLKAFLTQAGNRSDITAPRTCKFYNTKQGCKISNQGKVCTNLHICRHYLQQTCKFGAKCSRSHDILTPATTGILEKHGISTKRRPKEILAHLREISAGNVHDDSSSGSAPIEAGLNRMNIIGRNVDIQTPSKGRVGAVQKDESVSICFYYLRGQCLYKDGCRNFHTDLLYQWRYRQSGDSDWETVSPKENQAMELSYSDPENGEYFLYTGNGTTCKVPFKTTVNMTGVDDAGTSYEIQRLSTASSVAFDRQTLTTDWNWYWQDQKGKWKKYGDADRAYVSDITSNDIEQAYLRNPEGQMSFNTAGHQYLLDFPKMLQRNLHYKTEREVCRRPVFVSQWEIEDRKKGKKPSQQDGPSGGRRMGGDTQMEQEKAPPHWSRTEDLLDHCKLVEVQKRIPSTKKEFKEIEKLFCESMPSTVSILSIERIENGELYCDYTSKQKRMEKKKKDIGERRLFHGTKGCYVDAICKQGFDFRLNGQSVGTLHGKGSYFATTAKYSHSYTDGKGVCSMFIVKVLVGEYAVGKKAYVRPPRKDEKNLCSDLFDSCVNNVNDPTIFVIFDNSGQVYPEYLIRYEYKY